MGPARVVAGITIASRILGFARDWMASHIFGATAVWDAFSIAFLVPNLFRRLFGEGALTSAFVPVFVDHFENKGRDEAVRLLRVTVTAMMLALGVIVIVGLGVTYGLAYVPALKDRGLALELTRVMLPYMLIVCVTAILGAALNSLHHFATPAAGPVVMNVVLIGGLAWALVRRDLSLELRIFFLAYAVIFGGLCEQLIQHAALRARGIRLGLDFNFRHAGLREVGAIFVPATLGVGLIQVNELCDKVIAQVFCAEGAVSALYFSDRFIFLPISIIGTAMGVASLPAMSREMARGDETGFRRALGQALRGVFFLSVPATVGLLAIPDLIIGATFQHGEFDAAAAARTSRVLFFYAMSLWAYAANHILTRAFYARKDSSTPFRIMGTTVFLNLALNLILVQSMKEAGLALATSISGLVNLAALVVVLKRKHGLSLPPEVLRTLGLSAVASALMVPALLWLRGPLFAQLGLDPSWSYGLRVVQLGVCVAGAMIVYFGLSALLLRGEMRALLGRRSSAR